MSYILYPSESRGHFDYGWLKTWHSFSFGQFYDRNRMHFGTLRVLNEDFVKPETGFGMHPHKNMEIITLILDGELEHTDSMGNKGVLRKNEVQVMSAGSGILHSEMNNHKNLPCHLLQIWVIPYKENVQPRYDQMKFTEEDFKGKWKKVAGSFESDAPLKIYSYASVYFGSWESGSHAQFLKENMDNGLYAFVVKGSAKINGTDLKQGDAYATMDEPVLDINFAGDSKILLFEVGRI
ncbi:MAG: pirin family protein [Bacteroidia bacterium]|nr:pirin family protein [Bacteroidia bacterium]